MTDRTKAILQWLGVAGYEVENLIVISGDASFRRYLRICIGGRSYIVMDAPPESENCRPFIKMSRSLIKIGLNVPEVIDQDLERGFLLLADLGDRQYLQELNDETVERLYGDALGSLITLQACGPDAGQVPPYDKVLLIQEMELFREWFLRRHLKLEVNGAIGSMLDNVFRLLTDNALQQPQVCVHRDYHSRNLMFIEQHNPGILDFQDAVFGPVTYDLVSLLRDCYIVWPQDRVEAWALGYHELAMQSGILDRDVHYDEQTFLRWFDLMGLQRHLKAAGIFARLNYRDGKPDYLRDIPRTLAYVEAIGARYRELCCLHDFIVDRVRPMLAGTIPNS